MDGVTVPGGLPGPSTDHSGAPAPETGLIVQFDPATSAWKDPLGRDWSPAVQFTLPDEDVFAIDATSLAPGTTFTGVGTTLFNMAVNPVSGKVYVSNTESQNLARFEGPGIFGGSTVQGHLAESRITVLSAGGVVPRHLNKHIDYSQLPAPAGVKDHSLSTPVEMAVSPDGGTLYVAAFGSAKIGVFSTAALENDTFDPVTDSANYISLTGGGPSGLVLDSARNRLYVAHPLRQHRVGRRPRHARRDPAHDALQSRARLGRRRAAVPLRRGQHLQQRRGVVRQLSHLR